MKYFITGALIISAPFFCVLKAQTFGKVGEQQIDQKFVDAVQLLNPDFALSQSAETFKAMVTKNYALPIFYAEEARKMGLDKNPEIIKEIELVKQLAENKLLTFLYEKHKADSLIVSDADGLAYYQQHKSEFTIPANYTYIHATIFDSTAANLRLIYKKLEPYTKGTPATEEIKEFIKGVYFLTYESNRTVYPYMPEYAAMKDLPLKTISKPTRQGDDLNFYVIISGTPAGLKPFEMVKEQCKEQVRNARIATVDDKLKRQAIEKYPVTLSSDFFTK
jgi:hypothetical protein